MALGGRVRVPEESPGEAIGDGAAQFGGSLSIFEKPGEVKDSSGFRMEPALA